MSKRIKIQIFQDGQIHAEVLGVKGKKCTDYMLLLEELLDAEIIDSEYTSEYYEPEENLLEEWESNSIKLSSKEKL